MSYLAEKNAEAARPRHIPYRNLLLYLLKQRKQVKRLVGGEFDEELQRTPSYCHDKAPAMKEEEK